MQTHTFEQPLALPMKILNFTLPSISFVLTAAGLEVDWAYVALSAGSAMAGSLLFGYLRREKTFGAQLYKIAMSTIGGLILGSLVVDWRQYQAPPQIAAAYCGAAMVVLIFLRTVVSLFEENARTLTVTLIQRVFNIKLDKKDGTAPVRRRKGAGVHVTERPGDAPRVTIEEGAVPDEVRVIEQQVVKTHNGEKL